MNENEKVLDMDEMIASIIKETGFSPEQIDEYLDAEEQYLLDKGMIMWPGVNCTQEELDNYIANPEREEKDLDCDDMIDFIVRSTSLSAAEANMILDAEYNYEHSVGLAGDITHSFE